VLGHDSAKVVAVYIPASNPSPTASSAPKVDGVTTAGKVQCLTG
jgi:hypothetical protein